MSTTAGNLVDAGKVVVLYDGECGFCNRSIRFIAQRDPGDRFRFAPRDSAFGRSAQIEHGIDAETVDSMVVIDDDGAHVRSTGVIRIVRRMTAPWKWFAAASIIPASLRDGVYRFIACNRQKLSGKQQPCPAPTEALRARMV